MYRSPVALLLLGSILLMAVPTGSAFPDVPEEVYTLQLEDDVGDETERCSLLGEPLDSPSPCDILSYEVGNSDTHLFFRWTLATLEFGELGAQAGLIFRQQFEGSHGDATAKKFDFCLLVLEDFSTWEFINVLPCGTTEAWISVLEVKADAGANTLEIAAPLSALGPHLAGEVEPGEYFLVKTVETRVNNLYVEGVPPSPPQSTVWGLVYGAADSIANPGEDGNYTLQPFGSFAGEPEAPERIYDTLSGPPVTASRLYTDATSEVRVYNWTLTGGSFQLNHTATVESGGLTFTLFGPTGETLLDAVAGDTGGQRFNDKPAGAWSLEVALDEFIGSFGFEVTALSAGGGGPGTDGGSNGANGNDGNNTGDDDGGGTNVDDENGIPAPGVIVVLLAVMALLIRRRR